MKKALLSALRRNIPVEKLRCVRNRVTLQEGYGGLTLDNFPPYKFLSDYIHGDSETAVAGYFDWYYTQFIIKKYFKIVKKDGGFWGGGLHRLIKEGHHEIGISVANDLNNLNSEIVKTAILKLVRRRFGLCDEIRSGGYILEKASNIICTYDMGEYYLTGGHHRASILKIIGYQDIPEVIVIPQKLYRPIVFINKRLGREYFI